jgi:hypothetical protein
MLVRLVVYILKSGKNQFVFPESFPESIRQEKEIAHTATWIMRHITGKITVYSPKRLI